MAAQQTTAASKPDSKFMNLYSRQIGEFGMELMGKLVQMNVLIVGQNGIGVETAKNLILAGPRSVTVWDNEKITIADLGTNFYFNESDVGKVRSEVVVGRLAELNSYVKVNSSKDELTEKFLANYHAVVICAELGREKLAKINKFCREATKEVKIDNVVKKIPTAIAFIYAANNGAAGSFFVDFGPSHTITDPNGNPKLMSIVDHITADGIVTTPKPHGLDDNDAIRFDEVEGMVELNSDEKSEKVFHVKRIYNKFNTVDPKTKKTRSVEKQLFNKFKIVEDVSKFSAYTKGGIVSTVKVPFQKKYRSLEEVLASPNLESGFVKHLNSDKMYKGTGAQLHLSKLALFEFQAKKGALPRLHNAEDAKACVEYAKAIAKEAKERNDKAAGSVLTYDKVEEEIISNYALYARAELPGITAFLGGVVAQEVVKLLGKYTPWDGIFHFDYFELLQKTVPKDATPIGSRYDHQIAIFGKDFQGRIGTQKWFLVGSGALGCEYLKGMALMGLGAAGGVIYVTDMDRIEVSNLNRQFLFRQEHVGQPKSLTAAKAASVMNPKMNIKAFETFVGPTTENQFTDSFWDNIDGVWNALDNIKARHYTDSKCVFHEKPLLESGTLGTTANSEVIIPHKTKCYRDHPEQHQDSIPMCTLRNFPHFIEHCIEWGRAKFSTLFEDGPQEVNSYLSKPKEFMDKVNKEKNSAVAREKLETVKLLLDKATGATFQQCVQASYDEFIRQYRNQIADLTFSLPANARKFNKETKADEGEFWSGDKRFPTAIEFDPKEKSHVDYITYSANLFAYMLNLEPVTDPAAINKMIAGIKLAPKWAAPETAAKVQTSEDVKVDTSDEDEKVIADLKKWFEKIDLSKYKPLKVNEFEKDDDTNFHIDWITASSNMRATNYRIKNSTRHNCKMIAGKIIPALATTTAMVAGLVSLEFYKLLLKLNVDAFCNANISLALGKFDTFAPDPPIPATKSYDVNEMADVIPVPAKWTIWDKTVIDQGNLTLEEFLALYPKVHHGCEINFLAKEGANEQEGKTIYSTPGTKGQKEEMAKRMKLKLIDLYIQLYGKLASEDRNYVIFLSGSTTPKGEPTKCPPIVYYFRKRGEKKQ